MAFDFHKRVEEKWEITFIEKLCWNMESELPFYSQNNLMKYIFLLLFTC